MHLFLLQPFDTCSSFGGGANAVTPFTVRARSKTNHLARIPAQSGERWRNAILFRGSHFGGAWRSNGRLLEVSRYRGPLCLSLASKQPSRSRSVSRLSIVSARLCCVLRLLLRKEPGNGHERARPTHIQQVRMRKAFMTMSYHTSSPAQRKTSSAACSTRS